MGKNKDNKEKKAKIEINEGHYVELLDRTHVLISNLELHLLQHPLALKKKKIYKKIEAAGLLLADVYQDVGHLIAKIEGQEHDD
jgi:hypothetical protein